MKIHFILCTVSIVTLKSAAHGSKLLEGLLSGAHEIGHKVHNVLHDAASNVGINFHGHINADSGQNSPGFPGHNAPNNPNKPGYGNVHNNDEESYNNGQPGPLSNNYGPPNQQYEPHNLYGPPHKGPHPHGPPPNHYGPPPHPHGPPPHPHGPPPHPHGPPPHPHGPPPHPHGPLHHHHGPPHSHHGPPHNPNTFQQPNTIIVVVQSDPKPNIYGNGPQQPNQGLPDLNQNFNGEHQPVRPGYNQWNSHNNDNYRPPNHNKPGYGNIPNNNEQNYNNGNNYGSSTTPTIIDKPNQLNNGNQHSSNDISTKPPTVKPNYGTIYDPSKESDRDKKPIMDEKEMTTKKSVDDDKPFFVPLNPNQYNYGGDKIEINAPKRETNENKKSAEGDDEDTYPIDIRFGDDKSA